MCTLGAIAMITNVLSYFKFIIGLAILSNGAFLVDSSDILKGLGLIFIDYGIALIMLGLFSALIVFAMRFGTFKHNRFLIMLCFLVDTIIFAELIVTSTNISTYIPSHFSKELQDDCLRFQPELYPPEDCIAFFDADRTAGMRLVWESYFTYKDVNTVKSVLSNMQDGCCGFYRPFDCVINTETFPSNLDQENIDPTLLEQRVLCGYYPNYYPEQTNCIHYVNLEAGIVGGCHYDMGMADCLDEPVFPSTSGCASNVEDFVVTQIEALPGMLIFCSLFNLIFMLLQCCLWWKRKESDVFPELDELIQVKANYRNVPHQFEVVPHQDILRKEGFLPKVEEKKDASKEFEFQRQMSMKTAKSASAV